MERLNGGFLVGVALAALLAGCTNPDEIDTDTGYFEVDTETDTGIAIDLTKCAYGNGEHVNYFAEAGYPEEEVEQKIEAAWTQLFEGDTEDETVYYEAGSNEDGPLGYLTDVANEDVRSEGMSYGMMIAVQLDRQEVFDALWNWAKTYMWHGDRKSPFYEYFAWSLETDGTVWDSTPAPDGEEYFAMALYFAAARWGNGSGIYDYRAQADRLVSALKNRELLYGDYMDRGAQARDSGMAIFHPKHRMVRFSPKGSYFATKQGDHTDPSYHLPAFYQLWSIFGPEADRPFWSRAAQASRDFFVAAAHPETALTPDYAEFDGTPVGAEWDESKVHFKEDARRTVMNWSMDWAWFCADEREQALSDTLQRFFHDKEGQYLANYELDGTPLESNYYSSSLVSMNATSVLAATDTERSARFIADLWELEVPSGRYRYYDGMLYMFALLHVSGNFRIYEPD